MTNVEFEHLLAAWSADDLTAEERERFEATLLASPAARSRLAAWCTTEVVLRQALQVNQRDPFASTHELLAEVDAAPESSVSSGSHKTARRSAGRSSVRNRRRGRKPTKHHIPFAPLFAAAAIILIAIGALALRSSPTATPGIPLTGLPPEKNAIATVMTGNTHLTINGVAAKSGDSIPAAASLHLSDDTAVIRMLRDGSTVTLSEHARVRLIDGRTVTLDSGVATCSVTPQSNGQFAINAPYTRVEVVGTLFTVDADASSTLVSVVSGVVRVAPNSGGERLLHPGDEVTVNANGFVEAQDSQTEGIIDFVCIDIDTGLAVGNPVARNGTLTVPPQLVGHFNIRINAQPDVKAMRLLSAPQPGRIEQFLPFSVFGDSDGTYHPTSLKSGHYTIRVRAYADAQARQALGDACEITLIVP
jgi:uncharacterized Zn-binding protein involved in type VI secretion